MTAGTRTVRKRLEALGTGIPELLLPAEGIDLEAWAVVACDQFTQDRSYWKQVEDRVGSAPSTLRMILPEVFLEDGDRAERITKISASMRAYLDGGVFAPPARGIVYIERSTPQQALRRGLVLTIDLERYRWEPSERPLIRATEGTVRERIPPRMEIRRGAPLESPHVLLLVDDDERRLIEGLGERAKARKPRYSTKLMTGAGEIRAWLMDTDADFNFIADELERLAHKAALRYSDAKAKTVPAGAATGAAGVGGTREDPFLYAVGDGNHSLATAKAVWDEYKHAHRADKDIMDHPARWALVEVENIYDDGICFEPIHRVVFGTSTDELLTALSVMKDFKATKVGNAEKLESLVAEPSAAGTRYGLSCGAENVLIETTVTGLSTDALQPILDTFLAASPKRSIDYLHGADETIRIGKTPGAVGILLPPIGKSDLFSTVARKGPLPRKSFSMGEAIEKRFYLECRALFC